MYSLKTKFFFLFLLIGIAATAITSLVCFRQERVILERLSFDKLTAVRQIKKTQVETYFNDITKTILTFSEDPDVTAATKEFVSAFHTHHREINPSSTDKIRYRNGLREYYESYLGRLSDAGETGMTVDELLPADDSALLLQYRHLAENPQYKGKTSRENNLTAGSSYGSTHARYHSFFQNYIARHGFYDLFILDAGTGDIVYSVSKEADFASNILKGPFRDSNIARAFKGAAERDTSGKVKLVDFEPYLPSHGIPAAFIGAPIYDGREKIGVLLFQLSINDINKVMTNDRSWSTLGLGRTGESYLVGQDLRMRSDSRFLIEDPENYFAGLKATGVASDVIENIRRHSTSVLLQEVKTEATLTAQKGESDTGVINDYRGVKVLSSYEPLQIDGLKWAIISEVDADEVFAPVEELKKMQISLFIAVSGISLIISLIIARLVTSPLRLLTDEAHRLGQGDLSRRIDIRSRDEIGDLAASFNNMAENLDRTTVSKEYFDDIVTSMTDMLVVVSIRFQTNAEDGHSALISSVNKAACSMLGYLERELIGKPVEILFFRKEDASIFYGDDYKELTGKRYIRGLEKILISSTGRRIYTLFSLSLMSTKDDIVCVAQDISIRKEIEDLLIESNEVLERIFESSHMMIAYMDREFNFIRVNGAYADADGKEVDFFYGKNHFVLYPNDENEKIFREVVETGKPYIVYAKPFEYPDKPEEGVTYWDWSLMPVKDPMEKVTGAVLFLLDVTKRVRGEEALKKNEIQLASIADNTTAIIYLKDLSGRYLLINRQYENVFKITREDAAGKTDYDLFPAEFAERYRANDMQIVATASPIQFEEKVPQDDGVHTYISLKFPLFDHKNVMYGICGISTDITERKKMEDALVESEKAHEKAQQIAHLGHWDWDIIRNYLKWSDEIYRIFGVTPQEFGATNEAFLGFVHPEDLEMLKQAVNDAVADHKPYSFEHRIIRNDGSERIVHEQGEVLFNSDDRAVRMIGTTQDVTELRLYQDAAVLATSVFENAIEGVMITDKDGNLEYVNHAFSYITGYSSDEVNGKNPRLLKSERHDAAFYREMWDSIINQGAWSGEIWNRRKNGEAYPQKLDIISVRDSIGRTTKYVGIFHDMTDIKRQEEQIRYQSNHDALTGLANRVLFKDRLTKNIEYAAGKGEIFGVIFLGLDRFKNINESMGPMEGDIVLQMVAGRLKKNIWDVDTAARFEGDEFVLLIHLLRSPADIIRVCTKFMKAFSEPFIINGDEIHVTCSMGVSLFPNDGRDADTLIKNAQIAMRRAKEQGKNTYEMFAKEMNDKAIKRMALEMDLRKALARGEMAVYYQPKLDLQSGRIAGAESLVRWIKPGKEIVCPGEFIHIAEESDLIVSISEMVLRESCIQSKKWMDSGYAVSVAVNIPAILFQRYDLVNTVKEMLNTYDLPSNRLGLEITESILMVDADKAIRTLNALKEMGIHVYIDDFGTGYSSLSYLKRFKIDAVKIDQSFVRDLTTSKDSAEIATTVISMAHNLGLRVIAEGVETKAHMDFLKSHGCDEIQGYYFSRPIPVREMTMLLEGNGNKGPAV